MLLIFCTAIINACAHKPSIAEKSAAQFDEDGQAALAAGKLDEAREDFHQALVREPRDLTAVRGGIEAQRKLGHLAEVQAQFEARTQSEPDDGVAWYALGVARFAAGDEAASVAALKMATGKLPKEADAWFRLGVALFNGEKFQDARGPLEQAVALNPKSARYRVPLATDLDRLGFHQEAIAQLAPVAELAPTADEAKLAMAASRAITDPFRGLPQDARAQLELALGYLLRDAPGLAVAPLDELIARLPELGPAHALLGLAAARLDEAGKALTELKRAAELSPDAPQPHLYLAELFEAHGRPEEAIHEYGEALARDPLDAATLRKLGMVEIDRPGGAPPAIAAFRKAAALLPDDDATQLLLARAELLIPEFAPQGRAALEHLAEKKPDDPEVLMRFAMLLFDERQAQSGEARKATTERAVKAVQRVISLQPDNAAATKLLTALQAG